MLALLCLVILWFSLVVCRLSQEGGRSRRTAAAAVNYKEPTLGRQVLPSNIK